jgi:hypothetical protein
LGLGRIREHPACAKVRQLVHEISDPEAEF